MDTLQFAFDHHAGSGASTACALKSKKLRLV